MDFNTLVNVTIELFNMNNRQLGELQNFLHNLIGNKLRREVKFLMDEQFIDNKKIEVDLSDQRVDIVDLTEENLFTDSLTDDNLTKQVRQILEDDQIMSKINIENIIEEKLNNPAIIEELKELKMEFNTLKEELVDQQESIIEIALQKMKEENSLKGGDKMADEKVTLEQVDCPGCPEGCGDIGDLNPCDTPLETISFCCTLVIPGGFTIPVPPEERAAYIEDNFDIAAYFLEDEGCFSCRTIDCVVVAGTFGEIAVKQVLIEGCIKFIGGFCVASDSALDTGSQAPVCCEGIICVPDEVPVCIGGADTSCDNLRVIRADNVTATFNAPTTCDEIGGGDAVWEITGDLVFACGPCE